jgi:hypothetical protein
VLIRPGRLSKSSLWDNETQTSFKTLVRSSGVSDETAKKRTKLTLWNCGPDPPLAAYTELCPRQEMPDVLVGGPLGGSGDGPMLDCYACSL